MSEILRNPFASSQQRPPAYRSVKFAVWEVLKDYRAGLNVNQIIFRIQQRGLKDFTGKRNAVGQVSGDLVRHPKYFVRDPDQKVWFVRPLAPARLLEEDLMVTRSKAKRGRSPKPDQGQGQGQGQGLGLAEKKPKGRTLVGATVSVWWAGDNTFFSGEIVAFEPETDSYTVIYDDGDADNGIRFRNYEVVWNGQHVQLVRVYETDQDEMEVAANAITNRTVNGVAPDAGPARSGEPNGNLAGQSGGVLDVVGVPTARVVRQGSGGEGAIPRVENGGAPTGETIVVDRQGHADDAEDHPPPPKKIARTWKSSANAGKQGATAQKTTQPNSRNQRSSVNPAESAVLMTDALKCADLIAGALSNYRTQQVELTDLYNHMRGANASYIVDSTMLGELAERVEGTAWDSGMFAHPLSSEPSGANRFMRFCVESFIKSAKGMDAHLNLLLDFGEEKGRQLLECAKHRSLSQIQAVINANSALPGDSIVEKLRLVEQKIRGILSMMSDP